MIEFLKNLEPLTVEAKTVIKNELDEWDQVIFFTDGKHMVGYEINRKQICALVFENNSKRSYEIGAYGTTYNERA